MKKDVRIKIIRLPFGRKRYQPQYRQTFWWTPFKRVLGVNSFASVPVWFDTEKEALDYAKEQLALKPNRRTEVVGYLYYWIDE
jgi:hypothetical protein